jgi:hypothetical protein
MDNDARIYEYIRLEIDFGSLSALNRFSRDGWRVVQVVPIGSEGDVRMVDGERFSHYALLERMVK